MAKAKDYNTVYDAVISSQEEALSAEEAQLIREEAGEVSPPPPPPAPEQPEAAPAETKEEAEPAEPAEAKPAKKLSPAQERIQELVRERNEYERQLAAEREKWTRLEERQKVIQETIAAQEREQREAAEAARRANERPDPQVDPLGARIYDLEDSLRQQREQFEQAKQDFQRAFADRQVQSEVQSFSQALQADIQNARIKYPNYLEAANYATEQRLNLWRSLGHDEGEARRRVEAEAIAIAKDALDHGKSPGDVYYNLAKQWGFKDGAAPAAQPEVAITPKAKIQAIAEGTKHTGFGSTPNVGGIETIDIDTLTQADVAVMSEDQFLNLLKNPKDAARLQRKLASFELGGFE